MESRKKRFDRVCWLLANPQYYDYDHVVVFHADGSARLEHGDAQAMRFEASATYELLNYDVDSFVVAFTNVLIDKEYADSDSDARQPPFNLPCTLEDGPFAFRIETPFRIQDESKWPCILYTRRYRFDRDPLALGAPIGGFEGRETTDDDLCGIPWFFYAHDDRRDCDLSDINALAAETGKPLQWVTDT